MLSDSDKKLSILQEESGKESSKLGLKLQKTIRSYEKKLANMVDKPSKSDQTNQTESNSDESLDQKVHDLEKDLLYYRQTNKDLKSKLRELVAKNQKLVSSLKNDIPRAAHA
jgi:chromosome segregation ATPase